LLAKKNGITVTEFSVGMGLRLVTVAKGSKGFMIRFLTTQKVYEETEEWKDCTKYSIKLFPIGGSCQMLGEDEVIEDENAFNKKGVWARISVVFAGPFFNFILAFVLSMIIIGVGGHDAPVISYVEEGMPVAEAGLQAGDKITSLNGSSISIAREISAYLQFNPLTEKPVDITYVRDGEKKTVSVTPVLTEEDRYRLGFSYNAPYEKVSAVEVVKYSFIEVKYWIKVTLKSVQHLVLGKIGADEISGPVGIVNVVGDVIEQSEPYGIGATMLNILNMCILLSANLGVMNLLPLPALDGGRLVFLFIEVIRRKPVSQEKEGMVHLIGLVALMALMVFVMFNDISRIIG